MKLRELKKAEPSTTKSSGTDNPKKYIGKWEVYDKPQGIKDRRDPKVLAKEATDDFGTDPAIIKSTQRPDKDHVAQCVRKLSGPITEMVRRPFLGTLNSEYVITNEYDQPIGFAKVSEGEVHAFDYQSESTQQYRGQIMSALLDQMVLEADASSAKLRIQIGEITSEVKAIFERFGFRQVSGKVMERNAGSLRPPSVPPAQGMINRED